MKIEFPNLKLFPVENCGVTKRVGSLGGGVYFGECVECRRKTRSRGRLGKVEDGSVAKRWVARRGRFSGTGVFVVVVGRRIVEVGLVMLGFVFAGRIALYKRQAHCGERLQL